MRSDQHAAPTKSVGGEELHVDAFAFVGDPKDPETWKLPIHDCSHAKNAMARFGQTDGIPAEEKKAVGRKIAAKAKTCGFDVKVFEDEFGLRAASIDEVRKMLGKQRELRAMERRERGRVELRADAKAPQITMFIPYDSKSVDLGFTEIIAPGAFSRSIKQGRSSDRADVVALWNHDSSKPLARQANRTLEFEESDAGLTAVATLDPEIDYHREAASVVRSGLVRGSSFGFETTRDEWAYSENGSATRTLLEVRLFDVSPVTYPAYPESDAEARHTFAQVASSCGFDPTELVALLREVREGKVPTERREALLGCIGRLQGFVPAPVVADDYWERKIATRERIVGRA